jgi:hypothetical protein
MHKNPDLTARRIERFLRHAIPVTGIAGTSFPRAERTDERTKEEPYA